MDNLTLCSSVHYSKDWWTRKVDLINRLKEGDLVDVAGETCYVIGERDGRVEVIWRGEPATIDPMDITNIRMNENDTSY